MRMFAGSAVALMLFCVLGSAPAATLTVTTDSDEANCNCNGAACSPNPVCIHTEGSYKASTGCSLREALQNISDKAGNPANTLAQMSFPECGLPDAGTGTSNTIVMGTHNINIYSSVPDPSDPNGLLTKSNTQLPNLQSEANAGSYALTGGSISCSYDPNPQAPVGGNSIFLTNDGAQVSFTTTAFHDCKSPSDGVAIVNQGNSTGTLTLTGVTFNNIHAINQGNGGCIETGGGNLLISGGSFTACVVDNDSLLPGGGAGNGGALYIGGAGGASHVLIDGTTFQANVAGSNGGAIYLNGTDAVAITGVTFQANVAAGNTFSSGNAELGGGAIYAVNTATGENDGSAQGINASAFLIFHSAFTLNTAPVGTGGAILLSSGNLKTGTLTINIGDYTSGNAGIPGGIVASNFSGNVAGGSWDLEKNAPLDPRAGSGGAVYANGSLEVYASSFVLSNASTNASGGAIAFEDSSDSHDPLRVFNTTINGNTAGTTGGGIAVIPSKTSSIAGQMTLINDTIAGNSATGAGGGIFNANTTATEAKISNTILANNTAAVGSENCGGQPVTNVIGNLQFNPDATCGNMPVGDPELAPAAPFGGGANALVFVMKIGDTSAANGIGDEPTCDGSSISDLDEALNMRPQGKPSCDAGAYEAASLTPVSLQSFYVE